MKGIPYGIFILGRYGDIEWFPNTKLKMSPKEQLENNIRNGYYEICDRRYPRKERDS